MDFDKLTNGDKIIGGSFIVFFISLFLPWFSVDVEFFDASANGWDVGFIWGVFPFLLGAVMVAQIAIERFTETDLPEIPVTWGQVHLGIGGLCAVLLILKLLIGEGDPWSRSFGLFLAAIAAIGLAVGGFFKFQEDQQGATAGGGSGPAQPF